MFEILQGNSEAYFSPSEIFVNRRNHLSWAPPYPIEKASVAKTKNCNLKSTPAVDRPPCGKAEDESGYLGRCCRSSAPVSATPGAVRSEDVDGRVLSAVEDADVVPCLNWNKGVNSAGYRIVKRLTRGKEKTSMVRWGVESMNRFLNQRPQALTSVLSNYY
jgi:hypothetical protein